MRSLSDNQIVELRELYKTNSFSKKQLSVHFKCSPTTIALWLPEDNKAREDKFTYKRKKQTNCHKCNKLLKGHERCKRCTILLHGEKCFCVMSKEEIGYWWKN